MTAFARLHARHDAYCQYTGRTSRSVNFIYKMRTPPREVKCMLLCWLHHLTAGTAPRRRRSALLPHKPGDVSLMMSAIDFHADACRQYAGRFP